MAELINLNRARKARAKAAEKAQAAENRVRHGRGKSEVVASRQEADRAAREHEGKKRED